MSYFNGHDFPRGASSLRELCLRCGRAAGAVLGHRNGWDPCPAAVAVQAPTPTPVQTPQQQLTPGQLVGYSKIATTNALAKHIAGHLGFIADEAATLPPMTPRCECGAAAVGTKDFSAGHSAWCPVGATT